MTIVQTFYREIAVACAVDMQLAVHRAFAAAIEFVHAGDQPCQLRKKRALTAMADAACDLSDETHCFEVARGKVGDLGPVEAELFAAIVTSWRNCEKEDDAGTVNDVRRLEKAARAYLELKEGRRHA